MFELPIVIGLSPNTGVDDYFLTLKLLFQPWKWKQGQEIEKVETWFKDYFRTHSAVAFNAGRSALLAILSALEIDHGDEVLVQAFTCVAVPNCVLWCGAKPIFIDIDKTLNIDIGDAEKKITTKTKALIVQHTFGVPADLDKITKFCKKHQIFLIEDCAHALGATYKGKLAGTFGEAAFFSFGRDKIVSSIFGGVAITGNKDLGIKIDNYRKELRFPNSFWILRQLFHPLMCAIILPIYNIFGLGKALLFIAQKLKLLSFPVYQEEKNGERPTDFPRQYPSALAQLAMNQLQKLKKMNTRRKHIVKLYFEKINKSDIKLPEKNSGAVYLRFNVATHRVDELRFKAKKKGIILGNWYHTVIDPIGVVMEKIGYAFGSCPKAENASRMSLNLPTYPRLTDKQVESICSIIQQ